MTFQSKKIKTKKMNFNVFKHFILVFSVLFTFTVNGQDVRGVVSDDSGGLPGVSVIVKGTTKGVNTDLDGNYVLQGLNSDDVLVFSFLGYETVEEKVNGRSVINVVLTEDFNALDEVVVVGYGTKSRRQVTGAISSVDAEEITKTPVISAEQALQGQAPGINVVNAGSPGVSPQVQIRGLSTFGNSQPLYVIDGVVAGGLNEINPNDIESIDVLKDASTAAIYGSRASNGVVMITTKKGKKGRTRVNVDSYVSVQTVPKKLDLLNSEQFREYLEGTFGLTNRYTVDPAYTERDTDWQDAVFRSAGMYNTNVNVSGGSESAVFNASAGYMSQDGIIINTGFNRASLRMNSEFEIGEKFKIGETFSIADSKRLNEEQNGDRTLVEHMIKSLPYTPIYDANNLGGFGGPDNSLDLSDAENPVRLQTIGTNTSEILKVLGSVYGSYEIFNGLTYKLLYGFDKSITENYIHRPAFNEGFNRRDAAQIINGTQIYNSNTYTNSLTYDNTFNDKHKLNVLLVAERFESTFRSSSATQENASSNDITVVQGAATVTEQLYEYGLTSYVGRVNYGFENKYFLSAAIRRDHSSRFGANNSWGNFPSASVGWVVSEEDFLQDTFISNLKLRASWGVTGNDSNGGEYGYDAVLRTGYNYVGLANNDGISNFAISNPDLKWEESEQINLGIDLGFFDNAFTASLEYYDTNATDVLVVVPEPASAGAGNPDTIRNGADISVRGFEIALGYRFDKGEDLSWSANLNLGTARSEVNRVFNGVPSISYNTFEGENISRVAAGETMFHFYGLETDGLFQEGDDTSLQPNASAGDIKFVNQNGDDIIDLDDNVKIGDPFPDFTFGLNLSADYKNWDASLFFNGTYGNDIFNTNIYDLEGMSRVFNAGTGVLDRWTTTNTDATIPRFTQDHSDNLNLSDRYVEDGSFARLRNLTIGYSLDEGALSSIGNNLFSKFRMYVTGQNLFTITNYSGYDPEVGGSTVTPGQGTPTAGVGIDRGVYPQPRAFVMGVQLGF